MFGRPGRALTRWPGTGEGLGQSRATWLGQREPLKSMEPEPEFEGTDEEVLAALGLTADAPEISDHPVRAAAAAREHQVRLDEIAAMPEPAEHPDHAPGEAWGRVAVRQHEAVRQPARPMVRPSEHVLEADFEAGG
jgi:hypothetical protein